MSQSKTTEPMPLVHAVNVHKSFHSNEVLKGIDVDVAAGEVVCLLGPSGSGKTTFLRCINQLETIQGGRIWVDGELAGYEEKNGKLHRLGDKQIAAQRREIGMVFQRFNLFPHMTALGNVMEAPMQVAGVARRRRSSEGRRSSNVSASATGVTAIPGRCPAASSSGSRSPVLLPWNQS